MGGERGFFWGIGDDCGTCTHCKKLLGGSSVDHYWIVSGHGLGVKGERQLKHHTARAICVTTRSHFES